MPIEEKLLDLLVCPETREKLAMADAAVVNHVNQRIRGGGLQSRGGKPITEAIEGGLVRPDGKLLYPIRDSIPNLLLDDAIPL